MLTFNSFLQNLFQFVKSLVIPVSKKIYKTAFVISTGTIITAIIVLASSNFTGGGKNALAAFNDSEELAEAEQEVEENDDTEANVQAVLTEEWQQARLLVGEQFLLKQQAAKDEQKKVITEAGLQKNILKIPVISYSQEDYEVMLKIVEAEAGDCGEIGKILVANVIINRVKDDRFPDTITEVVYQRTKTTAQFSPVSNGSINRVTVTDETIACVERALYGEDYSEGALFFMMRSASTGKNVTWFDTQLKWLFKDGPHEFFTYY